MLTIGYTLPSEITSATYSIRVEFFAADADGQEGRTFLGFDTFGEADLSIVSGHGVGTATTMRAPPASVSLGW